jgi:hypothetical protein
MSFRHNGMNQNEDMPGGQLMSFNDLEAGFKALDYEVD